jgi:hypothetical protein
MNSDEEKLNIRIVVFGKDMNIRDSLKSVDVNIPDDKWGIDVKMTEMEAFDLSVRINEKLDCCTQFIDECEMDWQIVIQVFDWWWMDEWDKKIKSGEVSVSDFMKQMDVEV